MGDGSLEFLRGGGELGARVRAKDWSRTPLGPPDHWPQSLKTCVRIVLTSRQPMFVWWGPELINIYNDAYTSILGGKHPDALGLPAPVVWSEIWGAVASRAEACMKRNEGTYDEALLLIMERNGYPEETYYTFSYSPVPDEQGAPGGIICANTEDTLRMVGERQLALLSDLASRASAARSRGDACELSAASLSLDPQDVPFALVYILSDDRQRLSLCSSTGIDEGHPAAPSTVSASAAEGLWPLARVIASGRAEVVDLANRVGEVPRGAWDRPPARAAVLPIAGTAGSGQVGALVVGLNPYRLYDDAYRGFLQMVAGQLSANIAAADAWERERQRAEALAELDRAKTAFFSNVSHEFRTPLTLMLGPLEDVLAEPSTPRQQKRELQVVRRNGQRLLKLVNALLDFSRIEAGRAEAVFRATDLSALTADLASNFRSAMERAGLSLVVDTPPLPAPVFVDHEMWEKIVLNHLSNAFKFTLAGEVRVSLRTEGDRALLEVADTGTGIPAEEIPHLFERFHRVRGARSRSHEGTGIGLALVHELTRLHQGTVEVESHLGRGTRFRIRLLLGDAHLPPERIGATRTLASTATGSAAFVDEALRWLPSDTEVSAPHPHPDPRAVEAVLAALPSARILLADDNADMRDYVQRLLGDHWQVHAVADGAAALEEARLSPPDLLVSDLMMPGLDGLHLIARLREDPRTANVPVMLLSARAGEEAAVEGLRSGAVDYLVKPFSARELVARVATQVAMERARAAERAAQEHLRALFEQAPLAVSLMRGPRFVYQLANARYQEMVGRQNIVGRGIHEVFAELPEDAPVFQMLRHVLATGEPFSASEYHVRLQRRGVMEDVYFLFTCQPIRYGSAGTLPTGAGGASDTLLTVAVDVTEQVVMRRRLEVSADRERAARREAEEASRLKDEFLATVSHELRTPLNAIVGWSAMLRDPGADGALVTRGLSVIDRSARAQAQIIEDILDVSRIITGKMVLDAQAFDLAVVVQEAIESVAHAAAAKKIKVELKIEGATSMVGDAGRIRQVSWNLLTTAVRCTDRGGTVTVTVGGRGSHLFLAVADTGRGIDPGFLPHVWERFRQADGSTTRMQGGLGLGLAIVRHVVELHGGTVDAKSAGLGRGATFRVVLPVLPDGSPVSAAPQVAPPPSADRLEVELAGKRILVVDDEEDSRDLVAAILEAAGATTATAAGAAAALEALGAQTFDVLVSDIAMPLRDGYELIADVRAAPETQRIPAVALTAYARGEDQSRAVAAGFQRHVAKPVQPAALVRAIAEVLAERSST
ncbi:MAG: ATP-binding protein [Polyangiaceae bacterium]